MALKKPISEQDAFLRLSAKCAMTECCVADMYKMMNRWELTDETKKRIVRRLLKENYINECRYAHAFVRDKFRYNHWGWLRIERELRLKGIAQEWIDESKIEITDEDNLSELKRIIASKRRTISGKSDYEINGRLIRFALSRGFSYSDISKVLNIEDFN